MPKTIRSNPMKVVVERIANVLEEFEATGERMKDAMLKQN